MLYFLLEVKNEMDEMGLIEKNLLLERIRKLLHDMKEAYLKEFSRGEIFSDSPIPYFLRIEGVRELPRWVVDLDIDPEGLKKMRAYYDALKLTNNRCFVCNETQERLYLFSMDIGLENDLNSRIVSEPLKDVFKTKGFSLSEKITIAKESEAKWVITNEEKKNIYVVRKEEEKLNIYGRLKPHRVVHKANGGDYLVFNVVPLCNSCHKEEYEYYRGCIRRLRRTLQGREVIEWSFSMFIDFFIKRLDKLVEEGKVMDKGR